MILDWNEWIGDGLFSDGHMTCVAERAEETTEPSLAEMTAAAIDRLGQWRRFFPDGRGRPHRSRPYTTLGCANGPGAVSGGHRPEPETGIDAVYQALVPLASMDIDGSILWETLRSPNIALASIPHRQRPNAGGHSRPAAGRSP